MKARAPASEVNRFGSPSRPRMAAAVIAATPGAEVRIPVGSACLSSSVVRSSRPAKISMYLARYHDVTISILAGLRSVG